MNISEYTKRLGIDTSPKVAPLDIEAGKAGYTQYLADIESFKKAQEETQASVEASKSWWDKTSDFILRANGMSSQMSDNPIVSGFNAAVEAYKNIPEDNKPSDDWTDEERWAFGEKYAKDKNEAYSFAEKLNNDKANAKKAKQSEKVSKWATRNGVNRTLASMGSLGINAAYGGLGFYDALAQKAAGRDKFVNHGVLLPHEATNAMQGAIADYKNKKWGTLNENIPIIGGKGVGDAYQLRQSILQSALSGSGEGALFQFFGMAASQGVSDALSRGATSDQALAMGVVSGLAEAIPEMISVDKFVGMASAEGVQNLFKNILKQAGQEAGEEFTTSVINELADAWIMGGKSNYNQTVNALIASGMSLEQAKNRALTLTLEDLAYDVLSGAISGGVSGAGATGISRVNQQFFQTEANAMAKKALTPKSKKLIEEGKKYDTTKKRAEALEKKLADGKELTGYDLRMLANEGAKAERDTDVDTVRKAVIERMKAEGVSDSRAKVLGEIALNKAIGNEVSKVQDLMLQRDSSAMKVYNQMSEDMMKSGLGDSAWVENTPLEKLRAEKRASEQTTSEQRVQSGIDRLKADIAARYGVDTKEYKINTESLEGKIEKIDGGYAYKKSSADSKIHTEGITSPLTEQDIAELSAIEKIANELGIDIHVYETTVDKNGERSYVDKEGKRTSDSGYYDPNDNSIHIDLRAGENGEGTMLYTASHEVVHFIKENAPEHYDALEALVTKELVKGGYSIDKLIDEQRKKLIESEKQKLIEEGVDPNTMSAEAFENLARERIGETNLENIAREEMIAEACQSFLASKSAAAEIKALKTKNKGLWTALKKFFTSLFAKINKVYKTVAPDSAEGKYIASMRKAVKPIRDAFMEGAVEAAKKNAASGSKTEVKIRSKSRTITAKDSLGNELTAEQQEYFKNSKVRDENGNLLVMYHGTPNAGFTEFKSGTYFTQHKWYADQYQNPGASSLGYKRTANNPDTYAVYLNIKKPFDTRNKAERDIFYNEYYRQWGTGTDLMESGLPDWLDGMDLQEFLEENDYDYDGLVLDEGGVGGYGDEVVSRGLSYVVFDSAEVKNIDNKAPTPSKDIRHKSRTRTYSQGQVTKIKADLSNEKVYSKSEVMRMIKRISPDLRNRSFEALADEIWQGLNTHSDREEKQAFAHDVAQMFVDRMIIDAGEADDKNSEKKYLEWEEANKKLAYLRPAIDSIGFRQKEIEDIKAILYTKGYEYLRKRWGYKYQKGVKKQYYPLDKFIADLANEMPEMEHLKDLSIAEAIIEVDKLYSALTAQVTQLYKSTYKKVPDEFISNMRNVIADEIMESFDELGAESKNAIELKEKFKHYEERISFWIAENVKTKSTARWSGIISTKALQLRDLKKGAFFNATQHRSADTFKQSIEQLTKVQWRGNLSEQGVRKIFANLRQWYSMDNPMLYDSKNPDAYHLYNDMIALYLDLIGDSKKIEKEAPIEPDEYPMIYEVMNHLYTIMKNYGKIFRAGRWIDAAEIAKAYIGIIDKNDKKRTALTRAQSLYNRQFLEPMALARQADNYNPDGFFTQTMEELRRASINASIGEMRLRKQYDAFVDANQKYLMNAAKETVRYRGYDIPRLHLISLYMSMKRKQSREGLALNGFEYTMKTAWWDSEDVIKVPGYLPQSEKYNIDLINSATEAQMAIIAENFTDTDREYIAILEKLFNEELRKLKIERDMERQGYTNALEGYYYPIIRGGIARNIDTAKFTDINRATNSSFNQSTQEHAKQYLKIISADAMVNRHIKDMCKYYYMSQAIENYNVLYQIDTTEGDPNLNNPRNIAERLKVSKIWEKDFEYFKKLVADIQGIRDNTYDSDGWRLIESLRGNYAKFALGLNAKVLFTQASSIIAAGDVIGFGSLMSLKKNVGLIATKEDIEKYCPIAAVRSYEQTALKAMTLTDKMGKISEKMMAGISVMDDLVIRRLFAACQVEAKKRGAGDIGTEDNKIVAGKILEQIILETQQNSYATEKSSAMRSANPLWRGLTMFTADGMKIISRIHDAVGEFKLAKKSGNAAEIKAARKHLARSIAVATAISVYMTAIASLFNWIYGRKKKDEEEKPLMKVHNFTTELIGNFIGALPFISDLYDRIVNGFEVEDVFYDSINNLYGSISNLYKDATDMVDGKKDRTVEDLNRDLRSLLYAVGQVTGMPVRNVYNLTRGAIGIASPKAGYYIDSKFENTSLVTDLKKAVKEGNNSKTAYIMGLIYDERLDDRVSKEQSEEILRLYEKIGKKEIEGYTVIPKDIPDEIKRDGVTVELTDSQKEKIVSEYSKVISAIDKLISSSFYRAQSDEDRAYLIDYYHDKYYETAVNNALGIKDDKVAVYNAIGFSTYAKFAYVTRGIQSDKDKNGNTIPGSKKAKVTEAIEKASKDENKKLLYLASLGYTLTEEQRKKLCKYLNSLSVSASKKKSLAEACNLTYKNGKIYP